MTRTAMLIDMGSLAHPIWHMSQNDSDPNTTSTKIVERVRALASAQPHTAVCYDTGRSFRNDIDSTYKAQRPEHLATLQHQIDLALDTLRADGFPCWGVKGFEADDVLASATARILDSGDDVSVVVCSADKDLLALVSPRVQYFSTTSANTYDEAAVEAKFGIKPNQMRDYLALVGDASDNIIGAKGIGAKTAAKLLATYGTLEDLYAAIDNGTAKTTPGTFKALMDFRPRLDTVRSLLTLRTDAPIPFEDIFKPRVPLDVAEFGDDVAFAIDQQHSSDSEPRYTVRMPNGEVLLDLSFTEAQHFIDMRDDISFALPTLEEQLDNDERRETMAALGLEPERVVARPAQPESPGPWLNPFDPVQATADYRQKEVMPLAHDGPASTVAGATTGPAVTPPTGPVTTLVPTNGTAPIGWELQLQPQSIDEMIRATNLMFRSRFFSQWGHVEQAIAIVAAGRELGVSMMASLRAFHKIDGRPTLSASLMRGLVLRSGKAEYFQCIERTPTKATWRTLRKGNPQPTELSYTIEEAKAAWTQGDAAWKNSGWTKNSADMCSARASSKLARLDYDDVLLGLYATEEFE